MRHGGSHILRRAMDPDLHARSDSDAKTLERLFFAIVDLED
jgi:hypothetical protein